MRRSSGLYTLALHFPVGETDVSKQLRQNWKSELPEKKKLAIFLFFFTSGMDKNLEALMCGTSCDMLGEEKVNFRQTWKHSARHSRVIYLIKVEQTNLRLQEPQQ